MFELAGGDFASWYQYFYGSRVGKGLINREKWKRQ